MKLVKSPRVCRNKVAADIDGPLVMEGMGKPPKKAETLKTYQKSEIAHHTQHLVVYGLYY